MPRRGHGSKRSRGKDEDGDKIEPETTASPGLQASARNLAPSRGSQVSSSPSISREPYFTSPHSSQSWQQISGSSSSYQQPQPPPGKVAIPALRTHQSAESSNKSPKKSKTLHACDNCRKAKAGCTGDHPCLRCRNAQMLCVYNEGKRDRDRRRLSSLNRETEIMSQRNTEITEGLRRIVLNQRLSSDEMRDEIKNILDGGPTKTPLEQIRPSGREPTSEQTQPRGQGNGSNHDDSTEMGSTGSMDIISMDMDRDDTRPTGHLGKSSSVAMAQRTAEECQRSISEEADLKLQKDSYISSSYHTEELDIEPIDTSKINKYEWPDRKLADTLVRSYFGHVHSVFPILDKSSFTHKYTRFRPGSSDLSGKDTIWLGTLNIVFAISSYYAHLKKSEHSGPYYDHLIYVARAKMLCMDEGLLYEDPRVTTICTTGLLSLYYVATARLNRAWTFCGLAIRNSLTLGLHVRSEVDDLAEVEKEHRVRVWWALYSLECLLNELTGRPTCISDIDISTPLPINVSEDDFHFSQALYDNAQDDSRPGKASLRGSHSAKGPSRDTIITDVIISRSLTYSFSMAILPLTSSTYFIYRTQLSIISHQVFTRLYSATTAKAKWSDIQDTMREIDQRLQTWQESLPKELDVTFEAFTSLDWDDPHLIQRTGLAILLMNTRMILFRPCLCRFGQRLQHNSEKSKNFNHDAAEACIRSARRMISLLSWSATNPDKLYTITPWWTTLHYLCESLSVLMLEMAFRSQHVPNDAAYILDDAKKGVRWLSMMAERSISARKAWEIFDKLIRLVAPLIHWSVFDVPTEAPAPPGYNWRRSHKSHQMLPPSSSVPQANQPQVQNPPPEPLSQVNVQQHQSAQLPMMSPGSITAAWATQPPSFQPFSGQGGQEQYGYLENPLDQTEALNRFSMMSQLHGSFDEPWLHMLESSNTDPTMRTHSNPTLEGVPVPEPQDAGVSRMEYPGPEAMSSVNRGQGVGP